MPDSGKKVKQEYDYIVSDEEIQILLQESQRLSPKFRLWMWMAVFTGRRSSEICAMRIIDWISDWKNLDFSRVMIRQAKTNKLEEQYIVTPLRHMIKEYVMKYHEHLHGGWLFPTPRCKGYFGKQHIRPEDVGAMFSKLRKRLGKTWPGFLDRNPVTGIYRVHPHSIRHWHATRAARITKDPLFVKALLGWQRLETVMHYMSLKAAKEEVPEFLEEHYGGVARYVEGLGAGQQTIMQFNEKP